MSKKVCLALSFLIVAGLACSFFEVNTAPTSQTTQVVVTGDQSSTPSELYAETPTQELLCQPEKWKVVPIGKYEYQTGDGWKLIIIEVVVENQSQYWGTFSVWSGDNISVTTEGGFAYPLVQQITDVPTSPASPYGGRRLNSSIDIKVGVSTISFIPPGFNVRGWASNGQYREAYPFILAFQVADSQKHYTINIANASVSCKLPGGTGESDTVAPFSLDMDKDMGEVVLPTQRPASDFLGMTGSFELPGLGTLQFTDVSRNNDALDIRFSVVNASHGYPMSGHLQGSVIGDDGIVRNWDCVYEQGKCWDPGVFEAGPGLTANGELEFWAPQGVNNLKFLWIDEQLGIYQVLNVPGS